MDASGKFYQLQHMMSWVQVRIEKRGVEELR